jgi:hypothetical protein
MRCAFCKSDSRGSRFAECVITDALGATDQVLPPGVVCDHCHEYLRVHVERPFLAAAGSALQRFDARGAAGTAGAARIPAAGEPLSPAEASAAIDYLMTHDDGARLFPDPADPPRGPAVSRFLARAAICILAQRFQEYADALEYLVDETQFDLIRNHARFGDDADWPVHARRIYDPGCFGIGDDGATFNIVLECDVLHTPPGEYYLVLVLFGLELAINYGGPDIEGYTEWLRQNGNVSPLYAGPDARPLPFRPRPNERASEN